MSLDTISAVILAGGKGRRMQYQDKGLVIYQNRPLIEHVLSTLRKNIATIYISANRHIEQYKNYHCPVIKDDPNYHYGGPLAGIYSVLPHIPTPYLLTVPCDAPHIPATLGIDLLQIVQKNACQIACVHDGERVQPLFLLLARSLLPGLRAYLENGQQQVLPWVQSLHPGYLDAHNHPEYFANFNTFDTIRAYSSS